MITLDSETCGLAGFMVLLQYAVDDGEIELYNPWYKEVGETIELLEWIANHKGGICGFNLAFDWFHIYKMWTTWKSLPKDAVPEEIIEEIAFAEKKARDGDCLKPVSACDLMLWARKTKFQTLMDRKDVRIRRVPTPLAFKLAEELEKRIHLDKIFFARKKDKFAPQWQVFDIEDEPDFKDVVMKFAPSTALKALATFALNLPPDEVLLYSDVEVDRRFWPEELEYAPFALALGHPGDWAGTWPDRIHWHVTHWETNNLARKYARLDVEYTRRLWHYFDCPDPGDDDSELAICVANCRWRGYAVDLAGIQKLKADAKIRSRSAPTAPNAVDRYLRMNMSEVENLTRKGSTAKPVLLSISTSEHATEQAKKAANAVIEARSAVKEMELYEKLLVAERLQADFKVIGTFTSRMSGSGGLNAQGINKSERVRACFDLAFPPMVLCGGDFSAFEVVLAIAAWQDRKLEEVIQSYRKCHRCKGTGSEDGITKGCSFCKGKGKAKTKIHALWGTFVYKGKTYEEIVDSDGSNVFDYYTRSKSALFALIYGAESYTLANRLSIPEEDAEKGFQYFLKEFPVVGQKRKEIFEKFASMRQVGGIGSKIEWKEPADYIEEGVMGHRRYFTLENQICRTLYDLAQNVPKEWKDIKLRVVRRDREQTVSGAVQSALFAAAFQIQAANCRAAANHVIQSAGGKICKRVHRRIWDLQPKGPSKWIVQPLNVHDEIECPSQPEYTNKVAQIVEETVNSFKDKVPLLEMTWKSAIPNWSGKK